MEYRHHAKRRGYCAPMMTIGLPHTIAIRTCSTYRSGCFYWTFVIETIKLKIGIYKFEKYRQNGILVKWLYCQKSWEKLFAKCRICILLLNVENHKTILHDKSLAIKRGFCVFRLTYKYRAAIMRKGRRLFSCGQDVRLLLRIPP